MNMIAEYSHLKNGPAALFSSIAQDVLFSTDGVQVGLSRQLLYLTSADINLWVLKKKFTKSQVCICSDVQGAHKVPVSLQLFG